MRERIKLDTWDRVKVLRLWNSGMEMPEAIRYVFPDKGPDERYRIFRHITGFAVATGINKKKKLVEYLRGFPR